MIRSQQASHSILKQVLFFSTNSLCRLMAADDKTSGEKKKSSSSSNIDLFAAGERKIPKATVPVVNLVAAEKTIASVVDRIPVPLSAPIPVSSSSGKSTTGSNENVLPLTAASLAPSASRNNLIELQAELLRLEAEKEQLEIDQQRIDEEKTRLDLVDITILQLLDGELSLEQLINSKRSMVRKELYFRLAELANAGTTPIEKQRFNSLCEDLMEKLLKTDTSLHAELLAEIQKELNVDLNKAKSSQKKEANDDVIKEVDREKMFGDALTQWQNQINSNRTVQNWPIGTSPVLLPGVNMSMANNGMGRAMIRFPAAVPVTLLPLMMRSPEISADDLAILKDEIFTPDLIGNVVVDYSTFLATFRGQPNVSTTDTFERAKKRMAAVPGMSDRLRLFLLPEYRLQNLDPKNERIEKYSGSKYEPVFTVLSKRAAPKDSAGRTELIFGFGCLLTTLVTCFIYGTDVNSLNEGFVAKAMLAAAATPEGGIVSTETLQAGKEVVSRLLPVAFGLLGLQIVHDLGHYIAAKVHDTKISLPYYLPSLQIGIFGSITNFLTFPKSRKALFDIAISGPAAGFLFSLLATIYGLTLTVNASPDILANFPAVPTGFFSSSFLLHEIVNQYLPISTALPDSLTYIHPLVAVGVTGLLANALNFLPIGRLDGGRVAMAIGGRQAADQISFITLIGQAVSIFSDASPIYFFWIVLVVFLQRGADIPPEDDVTPVATELEDEKKSLSWFTRALTLAFCVSLTGAMVLPVPKPFTPTTTMAPAQAPKPALAPSPNVAPLPSLAPLLTAVPLLPDPVDV